MSGFKTFVSINFKTFPGQATIISSVIDSKINSFKVIKTLIFIKPQSFWTTLPTWMHNSLVGVKIKTCGPFPDTALECAPSVNAIVLPVPLLLWNKTSFPYNIFGTDIFWINDGFPIPIINKPFNKSGI